MPMRWWELRRRGATGLGLLAVLLQLVLSFGHIHLADSVSSSQDARTVVTSAAAATGGVPGGARDDDCPICITMHMASSGLLPAPPLTLGQPPELFREAHRPLTAATLGDIRYRLFQTRAPPIA